MQSDRQTTGKQDRLTDGKWRE